jgi:hypothetical protein
MRAFRKLTDAKTLYYLHLYMDISAILTTLSKALQCDEINPITLSVSLDTALDDLRSLKQFDGPNTKLFKKNFNADSSCFRGVHLHGAGATFSETAARARDELVDAHAAALEARFDSGALRAFLVLDPRGMPRTLEDAREWDPDVEALCEMFSGQLSEYERASLGGELRKIAVLRCKQPSLASLDFDDFAAVVITEYEGLFPTAASMYELTVCEPVDTSAGERWFARMNRIKTMGRSLLGDALPDYMEIGINGPELEKWEPRAALALFKGGLRHR